MEREKHKRRRPRRDITGAIQWWRSGVDGVTIEQFESDLKSNLYKIWNRMSSGAYFPPPVRAVSIPKKSGAKGSSGCPLWQTAWHRRLSNIN